MSAPTAIPISHIALSDGAIAVRIRANNDPTTDSVSTFYMSASTQQSDFQTWLTGECARVLALYNSKMNALSFVQTTIAAAVAAAKVVP